MRLAEQLGDEARRARDRARLTQAKVSERAGIAQADISRMETGRSNVTVSTIERIANAVDCDAEIKFMPRNAAEV